MRIDPTFARKSPDNFQAIRKKIGILGERSGVARTLAASATLDFPSVAAGACQELTVTVTGAKVSDSVSLGPPSAIEAGLVWSGFVSAANTVKVRVCNPTAAPIDPASASWRVRVVGF